MSWLRAVSRAVDVNKMKRTNLARIRSVADTVVLRAGNVVVGGANLIQDRMGYRNVQSFRDAIKRLEDVSVSCRGGERVLVLRRWLLSLNQIDKMSNKDNASHDHDQDPNLKNLETYYDSDHGREPLNFRDVFLHSQALEGITLTMILEPPNIEEIDLVLEIFRLCVLGGREIHTAIISSIQDLAKSFSSYQEEVLVKREELLQYAQSAVKGLKMNAELARIDVEVSTLKTKLDPNETDPTSDDDDNDDKLSQPVGVTTVQALKEALSKIRICSKLESLLLMKKAIHNGDSPESHGHKVEKLHILLESLDSSTQKAERRKSDHRNHKEEALHFRLVKAKEVSQIEKEVVAEIELLEKQKDELEVRLRKVNTSLSSAKTRLRNAREERIQFDEASNGILQHLQLREEELSKSIASFRAEAEAVDRCVRFIEDSWGFQSTFAHQKETQVNNELEQYTKRHSDLILQLFPAYKQELENMVTCFRVLVKRMKSNEESAKGANVDKKAAAITQKNLEKEYRNLDGKLVTAFNLVDNMKQAFTQNEDLHRKDGEKVKEVFTSVEKIKEEFESVERPNLKGGAENQAGGKQLSWLKLQKHEAPQDGYSNANGTVIDAQKLLDSEDSPEDETAQHEPGQMSPEIIDWEFDAVDN